MITLILFIIAGFCKSIMDTMAHHWKVSVFQTWSNWFNYDLSWRNKYIGGVVKNGRKKFLGINIPVALTDAWHFFQSIMIFCFVFGAILYKPMFKWYWDAAILGTAFNWAFLLFYKWIWIRKN